MESLSSKTLPQGKVLWLTGLSGSGKSTIAALIQNHLIELGRCPVMLDGDQIRAAIADPHWGYDNESRLIGSYRYARLASLFSSQGHIVIVPTISMFHEVQQWNRAHTPGYFEVYLRTMEQTRRSRDPKVLYRQQKQGQQQEMAGMDLHIEEPLTPDLLIDNDGDQTQIAIVANLIIDAFLNTPCTGQSGGQI
ncbi:adenylyl-sulfate kinase [Rheinheimera mesophila]|uniref:adenylyl-sulfate kinase n=1 Tax=Rheinheimera mesophila TaxID=1547515 RepID=UPI0006992DBE|nr:adenylyl-sulfate kinase [Rheinheimera mesophila]